MSTTYTLESVLKTRWGRVEILRWGRDDYSAEFTDADYSVRGSFADVVHELGLMDVVDDLHEGR